MAQTLLFLSIVLMLCVLCSRLTNRLGLPSLLLFIVLGMLFGSDGIFKIPFENFGFAEQACSIALIFIMFYGGFGTNWNMARPVAKKAAALASGGVVVTAVLTGGFCYLVMGFELLESMLIGAVISSTDAASVFAVLRSKKLNLKDGTASLLEIESGSNDPTSYMLTLLVLTLMEGGSAGTLLFMVAAQVVFGALVGLAVGFGAIWFLKRVRYFAEGMDTILVVACAVLSYALATQIGGNGYLATYLTGILLGNSAIRNKGELVHFFDGLTGLAQILIFFLLGLLAFPSQIPAILSSALAIALFLTFVARPLAVFLILRPVRCPRPQRLLVSWAGLRGASSIVFAIMATVSGVYTKNDVFHIVFCIALLSVAFQGTLLPWVAGKLDMLDRTGNVLKTFNDYQHEAQLQLIQTRVSADHPWVGKTIGELSLGADTLVVLLRRGETALAPKGSTRIEAGDLLVVSGELYQDDDGMVLKELPVDKNGPWAERAIRDLGLPEEVLIVMIRRKDGGTEVPKGEVVVHPGDTLVLSGWRDAET